MMLSISNLWEDYCELAVWFWVMVALWLIHVTAIYASVMFSSLEPDPEGSWSAASWSAILGVFGLLTVFIWAVDDGMKSRQKLSRLNIALHSLETMCQELSQKVDRLSEAREKLCTMCYSSSANVLFKPCLHLFGCEDCCRNIKICPYCQVAPLEKAVVFLV